jgi:urease accessory protein
MLKFDRITDDGGALHGTLTLTFEQRVKSRQKAELDNGEPVGLFLPRGSVLLNGQKIGAASGEVVEIRAAAEDVSTVYVNDPLLLGRACYHLGNRHVALQIGPGFIRYQHDHVLDGLVEGLGLTAEFERAPFEPEAGAYDGVGHSHAHAHGHHEH